jgi:hypothetical protein
MMTNPATLAGDGSQINYCVLPVLAACTEPLVEGWADIRGLWRAVKGAR